MSISLCAQSGILGIDKAGYSACAYIVIVGYSNSFNVEPARLFKIALLQDSVKIIIAQSKPDAVSKHWVLRRPTLTSQI